MGDEAKKTEETGMNAPCSFNNSSQSSYYMPDITLSAGDRVVRQRHCCYILRSARFILQKTENAEQCQENGMLGTECKQEKEATVTKEMIDPSKANRTETV